MPLPSSIYDLSTSAASNSPAGVDSIGTSLDDYLRAIQAIIKQQFSTGTQLASGSTITPQADGNFINVTGTSSITGIASTNSWNGRIVVLKFSDALTLTHSANLVLPNAANITTATNDVFSFVQESTGVWRCISAPTSVSRALAALSIDVGHASDTTLTRASAGTLAVEGVNLLTTATGAALAGSASQAFAALSIDVGHASDTTLTRASAGTLAVEGVNLLTTVTGAALAVPAGMISYFANVTAPSGWLKANGAAVSRTTYATLFSAIGTTYGAGDGSTTFNLPDLRGEFLRGFDDGRGVDTGRAMGSAQAGQFQDHSHSYEQATSGGTVVGRALGNNGALAGYGTTLTANSGAFGAETRPRNVAMLACIKH